MRSGNAPSSAAHDVLQFQRSHLQGLFAPKSVALVGATDKQGSVGEALFSNLSTGPLADRFYSVNAKRDTLGGRPCFRGVAALPETPDLLVIATPAASVPGVLRDAATKGISNAIVISAGFKERGPAGVALESEVLAIAKAANMRILGPNCLGLMCPNSGLNATFAKPMALPGSVAFLSQSGALLSSILDWSLRRHVGFSAFVSTGSMLDLGWADLLDYLASDPQTKSILLYMESVGDARSFLSAAREVALTKPIVVLKAGRSDAGAQAAASHTGSLTGADDVVDAAFERSGVLRVNSIAELFNIAEALGKQPLPKGKRLAIITNAGGPGVLATDALLEGGGEVATLSPATLAELDKVLPDHWSHGDPVDVLGDAGPERYAQSLAIVAKDPGADGMMVILTPQAMSNAKGTAEALAEIAPKLDKPVLASWMGGEEAGKGEAVLKAAGVPCFYYPDTAARTFNHLWRYKRDLAALYETPARVNDGGKGRVEVARLIAKVRQSGRTLMTETESKALLQAYGISVVETSVGTTADEAVALATRIGFPVVCKLNSTSITHKTDVGGVKLNLKSVEDVRRAFVEIKDGVAAKHGQGHFHGVAVQPMLKLEGYELILGASVDPQFGPVLLFGTGGQLVEVFKDRALGLPPLNRTLARRMMEGSRIYQALKGVRGRKAVDLDRMEEIMVELSQLILDHPSIRELDLNPLLAGPKGIVALDARVILYGPEVADADLPKPAIRPYPYEYAAEAHTRYGQTFRLRPIRPEDEPKLTRLHKALLGENSYAQFIGKLGVDQDDTHAKLLRLCMNDFDRQVTLVAERGEDIVGVGRVTRLPGGGAGEFAVQVEEAWRGQGLGKALLEQLVIIARAEGLNRLSATIQDGEEGMLILSRKLGFSVDQKDGHPVASLELK